MQPIRGKIWGSTCRLIIQNNVEIHRIEVDKGGFCSEHKHEHKCNAFFVEKGCLEIIIYRQDAGQTIKDRTILQNGDSTYIEPGVYHQFRALKNTIAFEMYWIELSQSDIIRKNVGGKNLKQKNELDV